MITTTRSHSFHLGRLTLTLTLVLTRTIASLSLACIEA